jgi:alkanesulfonate monooxygenase SsuD/methylene tetrahydromethanopterin reductase-like flavin-dependent oxidoreductase (luciferase family)
MEVGCLQQCQNFEDRRTDQEVMENILRIADLYEPAGFDFLLMAEHHFHGYSMTPSPPNFLAYMAGRTTRIKLGSGVIIVPWNDPYRAATQVLMLDYLSKGRAVLGLGRGLSKLEMENFGIDMSLTRPMYDEGARKIIETLNTGIYPGGGQFYNSMKRCEVRPAPLSKDWSNRTYCVGMSRDSAIEAGRLGGRLMTFTSIPWEMYLQTCFDPYKEAFIATHGREPGPMVCGDCVYVHEDEERAKEIAYEHFGNYVVWTQKFYQTDGEHLKKAKGYEDYAERAKLSAAVGTDAVREHFCSMQLWGTPKQIVEKVRARQEVLRHPFDLCALFGVGGMDWGVLEDCIKLMGRKVIPELKKLTQKPAFKVARSA